MVTIYDIAKLTGFSVPTVSKALNNYSDVGEKTKRTIIKVAKEMGYLPNSHARALTTKKSWSIGVIYNQTDNCGITNPFLSAVIDGFKRTIEPKGYDLLFLSDNIGKQHLTYLEHCKYRCIDGVVVMSSTVKDNNLQELIDSKIPKVFIDLDIKNENVISSDNEFGIDLAVKYLYELGHRKIGFITGASMTYPGKKRKDAFYKNIKKLNIDFKSKYLVEKGYFTIEDGYKAMNRILELTDKPTAVVAAADYLAIGAIKAIREKGYNVPEDFSIIGFDDIELANLFTPSLTTVRQNVSLIGEEAATQLIKSIHENNANEVIKVPVELVVRDSCRRINNY
ncbi:MAG: LacI family DNA-binding transcriptional regulator [Eubacteriales bacterium]